MGIIIVEFIVDNSVPVRVLLETSVERAIPRIRSWHTGWVSSHNCWTAETFKGRRLGHNVASGSRRRAVCSRGSWIDG